MHGLGLPNLDADATSTESEFVQKIHALHGESEVLKGEIAELERQIIDLDTQREMVESQIAVACGGRLKKRPSMMLACGGQEDGGRREGGARGRRG